MPTGRCPLWVISGHADKSAPCPLYPLQWTFVGVGGMSEKCHKPTCSIQGTHLTCSARKNFRFRPIRRVRWPFQASLFQPKRTRTTAETMQIIPKVSAKTGKAEGKRQNAAKKAMVSEPSAIPPR
jgi:hypothetical protein